MADKVKEYETTNKELREEAAKKHVLLEEVEEKDKVPELLGFYITVIHVKY